MTTYIYSHNPGSQGAKELAKALGIRRIRHEGSRVKLGRNDTLINWGSGRLPDHVTGAGKVVNSPEAVATASNKRSFFQRVGSVATCVPSTTVKAEAAAWGSKVVVRHVVNGHSGAGIEIVEAGATIPDAPLYTKYIGKETEWRIHVLNGQVIDYARKIKDPEHTGEVDWHVRNHAGGFIFARNSGAPSEDTIRQAVAAVEAVGLHFGAVDVIVGAKDKRAYVLEINTAPGLVGTTVTNYAGAFRHV